jgi:hypothetical protein
VVGGWGAGGAVGMRGLWGLALPKNPAKSDLVRPDRIQGWRILALPGVGRFSHLTIMQNCEEYDRLHVHLENVLGNLAQSATLLLELFRARNLEGVRRLDRGLELILGEKERSLGALRQHVKEHDCVQPL